jgi:hypothetical protein
MSKQTALQWFIYKITVDHDKHFIDMYRAEMEEALQMEREQIVNTFKDAQVFKMMEYEIRGEQYYKQTYGGQDE